MGINQSLRQARPPFQLDRKPPNFDMALASIARSQPQKENSASLDKGDVDEDIPA